jgi:hypothetical protein
VQPFKRQLPRFPHPSTKTNPMNKKNLLLLYATCLATFALIYLPAERLFAQSPEGNSDDLLQVVINYGESNEMRSFSHGGVVEPVSLRPNSRLPFTIQVPTSRKGYPVMVGNFDGGQVNAIIEESDVPLSGNGTPPNLTVSAEGTVAFSFQSGSTTGVYRLLVMVGPAHYQIQIYVVDPNLPGHGQY